MGHFLRRNSIPLWRFSLNQGGTMATKKRSSSKKKSSGRKYGKAASKSVKSAMHRRKKGTLKSGKGGKGGTVKSRKQAIAIGYQRRAKKAPRYPKRSRPPYNQNFKARTKKKKAKLA
jgi:hypothetical protein